MKSPDYEHPKEPENYDFSVILDELKKWKKIARASHTPWVYIRLINFYTDDKFKVTEFTNIDWTLEQAVYIRIHNRFIPHTFTTDEILATDWYVFE